MINWIIKMWHKHKDIFWYCFFGGLTTLVNIAVYYFCKEIIALPWEYWYLVSNAIAWVAAVLFAYVTNRKWVFKSTVTDAKGIFIECVTFFGFRLASGAIDMTTMFVMVTLLGINDFIAKLVCQFIVIVLNYVFSKLFIFKDRSQKENTKPSKSEEEK